MQDIQSRYWLSTERTIQKAHKHNSNRTHFKIINYFEVHWKSTVALSPTVSNWSNMQMFTHLLHLFQTCLLLWWGKTLHILLISHVKGTKMHRLVLKKLFHTSTFFSQFFSFLFKDCTTVMKPTASDVDAPSIVCCSMSVRAWKENQNFQLLGLSERISTPPPPPISTMYMQNVWVPLATVSNQNNLLPLRQSHRSLAYYHQGVKQTCWGFLCAMYHISCWLSIEPVNVRIHKLQMYSIIL